ncbi:MAG: hypothetical protein PVI86_05410 [Phycisphaerae bacterium]|jgi:hypothetical protein
MDRNSDCMASVERFEQQLKRLRNRLAETWQRKGSPTAIRRLEGLMRRRWQMLDAARRHGA